MPKDQTLPPDVTTQIEAMAQRYRRAGGPGMQVLSLVGSRAEDLLSRLPEDIRSRLDRSTVFALESALSAAERSRGLVKDQPDWLNRVVSTGLGAAGGMGGVPTALAELPVTTTLLLRSIQGAAAEHGFDPAERNVQFDSLRVFAAAGPLGHNAGADTGFFTTRLTLTGASVHGIIAGVAPKLATALGRKLAAQAVPVLGAVTGAATNYAFSHYYQEIARVHFGLRRLAIEADIPGPVLTEALRAEVTRRPISRADTPEA